MRGLVGLADDGQVLEQLVEFGLTDSPFRQGRCQLVAGGDANGIHQAILQGEGLGLFLSSSRHELAHFDLPGLLGCDPAHGLGLVRQLLCGLFGITGASLLAAALLAAAGGLQEFPPARAVEQLVGLVEDFEVLKFDAEVRNAGCG